MAESKVFSTIQMVGRSFFLPVSLLPAAGILLGLGASFTNETTISAYGLQALLGSGTVLHNILAVMSAVGSAVFGNLPLIFALAVALGMAKNEKAVAVLASGVAFIIMHVTISSILTMEGKVLPDGSVSAEVLSGAIAEVLGITSLQMGVFGGIICGLMVAALHNRFYKIELPAAISYFAGVRFVPIICSVGAMVLGAAMSILWPIIQTGISFIGSVVMNSSHVGTFIFGFVERALIPFGLHHVFYIPFWQTGLGGSAIVDGIERFGSQGIYFAELASKNVSFFNLDATRFLTGKYPFMMAGLPAAALAMYHCSKPEKREVVGGLLMSAALTSFLTGITEPIEFTFLFIAPFLFVVHCGFAGLAFVITHVLKIAIGTTFSDGLIDFTLYGILQGNAKTNWLLILPVFAGYFALYYFFFKFAILKWDLKTPGREEGEGETKLYTRADYNAKKGKGEAKKSSNTNDTLSPIILRGLGGKNNIRSVDACATRLRLEVSDPALVQDDLLKQSGAKGILKKGSGVQVIYGPQVTVIKSNFEEYLADAEDAPASSSDSITVASPLTGKIVPLDQVKDEAFSSGVLGPGIAILPEEETLFSPIDGTVDSVTETKHAVNLIAENGLEILIHIGMDTVALKGAPFTPYVKDGDKVITGAPLIDFDTGAIKAAGLELVTPVALPNGDDYKITFTTAKSVKKGDPLITVEKKV